MYSGRATCALPHVGFPIRTSRHHRLVSISTGLIAAAHVLHRLSAPRHPPCALVLLIEKNTCVATMEFSRCARAGAPAKDRNSGLSKLNSAIDRGQRISRRPGIRTEKELSINGPGASGVIAPDSLE